MPNLLPKVLLIRPDKAGDAIKTLPVLRALRKVGPAADYHLLCSEHNQSVFALEPGYVVHTLKQEWTSFSVAELQASLSFSGEFDTAILLPCDTFRENERLLGAIPAKRIFSTAWKFSTPPDHHHLLTLPQNTPAQRDEIINIGSLVDQAMGLQLTEHLGEFTSAPAISEIDELEARLVLGEKKGTWIALCPFAGLQDRTHPIKNWEKFLKKISRQNPKTLFFLVGTATDQSRLENLRSICFLPERVKILSASSFRALGAYLTKMDGVVAVDSGPLHLAIALGVPSLGVLSGGDSARWFATTGIRDKIVRRGFFSRFPSARQITLAFRSWSKAPAAY